MAISSNVAPAAAPLKQTLASAYIDFTGAGNDWAQQYLPDLMEKEAEIFGNRTISGFLNKVGAEEAMQSDQVVWSEQGRLHLAYGGHMNNATTIDIDTDADGQNPGNYKQNGSATQSKDHGIRKGDMLLVASATTTQTAIVTDVATTEGRITVGPYGSALPSSGNIKVLVFGSEYSKGMIGRDEVNTPGFKSYDNKPIIIKDRYEISGSDASQIGWVEVAGEEGQGGYLWYLKASGDTKARFTDYLEMAMIEAEKVTGTGGTINQNGAVAAEGTEGLFKALTTRGNESTGINGVNAATDLAEFDSILAEFDKNGAIEENMMFVNRATALAMDDMLASMNSYGAGGTSYGVFQNDENMALNLGFSGFRRGSYDFYKSDWRYLNDRSTRGLINDMDTVNAIRGVMIPAGVTSVYDKSLGKNMKRPFLHVRYRSSATDDRKFKTWTTGSVGAATSALDAMQIHMLSERCLVTQGANNFMLMN